MSTVARSAEPSLVPSLNQQAAVELVVSAATAPLSALVETTEPTAIVYCEANFGAIDGKTANGLVRHSEKYRILSIIDSEQAGQDAGSILDNTPNDIPVLSSLTQAIEHAGSVPDYFIYGMAPASGHLSITERHILLEAIALGMNVVNGLHEFLSDDPEFVAASIAMNVTITDVRKPRAKSDMHTLSGQIDSVTCPRIAVLGTDCAIGKRTTATVLARALNERGIRREADRKLPIGE